MPEIITADCIEAMRTMPEGSIDAIVTDPPYGLGFMGKTWDNLPPGLPWTQECLRVLKPGGHLLAFGGTRTSHRLVCAIEDAEFEIRDSILWLYGSGFPKSHNLNGDWQGWGTALKPAHEPIVVARKPLNGTVAANVLAHGTGALNVDGCRIAATVEDIAIQRARTGGIMGKDDGRSIYGAGQRRPAGNYAGRWPANVVLDPEAAALLDAQTGDLPSQKTRTPGSRGGNGWHGQAVGCGSTDYGDSGGASRFYYCAKASKAERNSGLPECNTHPTVKPLALMQWLVRLVTPPDGLVLDPFAGSGTTGCACIREGFRFIGIEREPEHAATARLRIAWHQTQVASAEIAETQLDLLA